MVIYVDSLLLLNFIINFLLLTATARITGAPIKRLRTGFGAAIGAVYALMVILPDFGFLGSAAFKLVFAVLMAMAAFGISKKLPRYILTMFGVSMAFAGAVMAIEWMFGGALELINGIPYLSIGFPALVLITGCTYALLGAVFNRAGEHSGKGELTDIKFELDGRQISATALVDTGNTLRDSVTNLPVAVVDYDILKNLLPKYVSTTLDQRDVSDSLNLFGRLSDIGLGGKLRLIPYSAVGTDRGMLLALRCDRITVGDYSVANALAAFSPTSVSDGGGYVALVGKYN